jgi:hypothetical protein
MRFDKLLTNSKRNWKQFWRGLEPGTRKNSAAINVKSLRHDDIIRSKHVEVTFVLKIWAVCEHIKDCLPL